MSYNYNNEEIEKALKLYNAFKEYRNNYKQTEKGKEAIKRSNTAYYNKMKTNPDYMKILNDKARERYNKLKDDPEFKQKNNERTKLRYLKKKLNIINE
jgi:pantothenate synthetase